MTVGDFANLVEKMRNLQKEYFRHYDPAVMRKAKEVEKQVDTLLQARRERNSPQKKFEM